MADAKGVVLAFGTMAEGRESAEAANGFKLFATAGEDLVRIGLVAHVPDQAVMRRIKTAMQRQRQFHRAQVGGEMPADATQCFNQVTA